MNAALEPPAVSSGGKMRSLAVMFTDMAGSTEYAENHGGRAALEKRQQHNGLLLPLIDTHRGRLVRIVGDALLVIFDHAVDAARCAIAIQRRLAEYNAAEDLDLEDLQIHVRIGIHYGKVIEIQEPRGIDLVGRAVNVAARVEAGSGKETDQILISDAVLAQLLLYASEFVTELAGIVEAKGVGGLRVHRLLWKEGAVANPGRKPAVLAGQTVESLAQRLEQEEALRAVHGVFVDTVNQRGYVLPVWVHVSPAEPHGVRPRAACDRVMQAAAKRAVQSAFAVMQRLGFDDAQAERHSVEWWIDGPNIRYEGASLGVATVLATIAAYSGVEIDPGIAVTGSVNGEQVVRVAGVSSKWDALCASGRFHTLILPSDNLAELPAAARSDPKLRVIEVPTVEAAILDVLGPALGLAAGRLVAVVQPPAPSGNSRVDIHLWVQREERRELTRDMSIMPAEDVHTWNIGDRVRVCAQVDRDCHLAVVNIGPTGNVTVLIPNAYHADTSVRAGQVVTFPGPEDRFPFELQGPPGRQRLVGIASTRPMHLSPADFDDSGQLVRTGPTTRDIVIVAEKIAAEVLGRCEIDYYVSAREAAKVPARVRGVRTRGGRPEATEEETSLFRPLELG